MNTPTNQTPIINTRPFDLGQVVATSGAVEAIAPMDCRNALMRHHRCDWGDCCPEDWEQNDQAIDEGNRMLSVYQDRNGLTFCIITEADRSVTTILLPDEY